MLSLNLFRCQQRRLISTSAVVLRRKPVGAPRAAHKRSYVRKRTYKDPNELVELYWRYAHYRTKRRMLADYFRQWNAEHYPDDRIYEDLEEERLAQEELEKSNFEDADEFERLIEENAEDNASVRREHEAYCAAQTQRHIAFRQEQAKDFAFVKEETRREAVAKVERATEETKSVLTSDNLDEAFDRALANPTVDYDFAIDLQGNRYYGIPRFNEAGQLVEFNRAPDSDPMPPVTQRRQRRVRGKVDELAAGSEQSVSSMNT